MGNFFNRCKECKACCKTSDRFVHIHVCSHEKNMASLLSSMGQDTKDIIVPPFSSCRFLGENGCSLGDTKPFQCMAYPVLFLDDGSLGIDPACTHSGEYVSQLEDPESDAGRHFQGVKKVAAGLDNDEKRALADWSRFVCDIIVPH